MHLSHRLLRTLAAGCLALSGLGLCAAQPAPATVCPPVATAPTPEQVRDALARARDRGFLWRIERDGRHSWIYGTVHIAKFDWAFPGPQLGAALREARVLALELDLADPAVQQELQDLGRAAAVEPPLPAALRQRLLRRIEAECLAPADLASLPALLQATALTALAGRRDGLDPAYGIDGMLAAFGHAAGKRVVSLESLALQLAMLKGRDQADSLRFFEQTLDLLDSGQARPQVLRIAQVWAESDHAALSDYAHWCECMDTEEDRALMRRLLDERNPGLADSIDRLHREGGTVLAAVGSLHFIGPQGLPALLAARGYRVERTRFEAADPRAPATPKTP